MRYFSVIALLLIVILAGCDEATMMKKIVPPGAESAAKGYIDLLRQKKFEDIEKNLDPSIKKPDIRTTLVQMAQLIPEQNPDSVKVVGAHVFSTPASTQTNLTFEYQFQQKWLLINVATQAKGGATTIIGFNVNPIPDSLENLNKFRLAGKTPLHYGVLALAILIPLFILYVLVLCIRTRIEKRKWLWVLFILFGYGTFSLEWTTGHWTVNPLSIQLLGAGASGPLYGSVIISICLPLGAIIFLIKRKELAKRQGSVEPPQQVNSEKEDWLGEDVK